MDLSEDFKSGPLDAYRHSASFDWKKLKLLIESEDIVIFKKSILNIFKTSPVFQRTNKGMYENQRQTNLRLNDAQLANAFKSTVDDSMKTKAFFDMLIDYDGSLAAKYTITKMMFPTFIRRLGNTEAQKQLAQKAIDGQCSGCFCMTEVSHGSNSKAMRTRATYESSTKEFVLHTPDFEAAKCWIGNLGMSATHAFVFAQLYTEDGKCHGVHQFIVQIRDEETRQACPGISIYHLGEKVGSNGVDNGAILFKNVHIPKTSLMNKLASINDEGKYVKAKYNPFMDALIELSMSRLFIGTHSAVYLVQAITIALRYAALRKQFARNDGGEEIALIEYQSHQYRLIPSLAAVYIFKISFDTLLKRLEAMIANNRIAYSTYGSESHALSCAMKAEISWYTQSAIQECREACGGHGYLNASQFGNIRNTNDAFCTLEGDNNVILHQTGNWLLKQWTLVKRKKTISYPFDSINFLNQANAILRQTFSNINSLEVICSMYEWLICYMLQHFYESYEAVREESGNFDARNANFVFSCKPLAKAYIQYFMLKEAILFAQQSNDAPIREVLRKLCVLYGLYNLEKFSSYFYQGKYMQNACDSHIIQKEIAKLCADLKSEAISLVDAIAPDDYLLNSVLGYSDGEIYKHLEESFIPSERLLSKL